MGKRQFKRRYKKIFQRVEKTIDNMKNLAKKIINDEDLKASSFNFAVAWAAGNLANVISNSVFHFDLNRYNSVDHFAMGVGIGTLAYRKAGKGVRGVVTGLVAATLFNAGWEYAENKYVFKADNWINSIDTLSDIACVYTGSILSFLGEKAKGKLTAKKRDIEI